MKNKLFDPSLVGDLYITKVHPSYFKRKVPFTTIVMDSKGENGMEYNASDEEEPEFKIIRKINGTLYFCNDATPVPRFLKMKTNGDYPKLAQFAEYFNNEIVKPILNDAQHELIDMQDDDDYFPSEVEDQRKIVETLKMIMVPKISGSRFQYFGDAMYLDESTNISTMKNNKSNRELVDLRTSYELSEAFEAFLTEGILPKSVDAAMLLVCKYLKKKTGKVFWRVRGIEVFDGPVKGFGIRLLAKGAYSVRFNFQSRSAIGARNAIDSVDVWLGDVNKRYNLDFEVNTSFIKVLPVVANVLNGKFKPGKTMTGPTGVDLAESIEDSFDSEYLTEAKVDNNSSPSEIYDEILDLLADPGFKRGWMFGRFKAKGEHIFTALCDRYPEYMTKQSNRFKPGCNLTPPEIQKVRARMKKEKDEVLRASGCVGVSIKKVSGKEEIHDDQAAELEANQERLTFETQLKDLENLLRLVLKGASNAIFVAGAGGVGKTHTTEAILAQHGLRDGAGYFKNTGSISTAGMYSLLFKHRDGIVLFDDSDDALKDQSSRNILKAATDTKKVRKLVWNKMGANVADPDEMTYDEIESEGLIPRYFEFTGKIIFISNLTMDKLDPDGALRTRAFLVNIDPTAEEVYDFMEKICDNVVLEEGLDLTHEQRVFVISLLRKSKSKQSANLRKMVRGFNMYAGALADGIQVSAKELQRMVEMYA